MEHVIAEISYLPGRKSADAPTTCTCGWEGPSSDFAAHRTAGIAADRSAGGRAVHTMVVAKQEPTAKMTEAWLLCHPVGQECHPGGQGLTRTKAAAALGISVTSLRDRLLGYKSRSGTDEPVPGEEYGEIRVRRVAPEVMEEAPAAAQDAPAAPVGATQGTSARTRRPTPGMREAWRLCHDEGMWYADAARAMGTTSWTVQKSVEAYMRIEGIEGQAPGRMPKEEALRRSRDARIRANAALFGQLEAEPSTLEPANQSDNGTVSFAEDPSEPPTTSVPVDHGSAEAVQGDLPPAAPTPAPDADSVADGAGDAVAGEPSESADSLHLAAREPTPLVIGEPVAVPTPVDAEPLPLLEDLSSSDHAEAPALPMDTPELVNLTSSAQAANQPLTAASGSTSAGPDEDEPVITTSELRLFLGTPSNDDLRASYVEALLAAAPAEHIRDRIERVLGIDASTPLDADNVDYWADGYRRALLDILDAMVGIDHAYLRTRLTEKIARLAIEVPMP